MVSFEFSKEIEKYSAEQMLGVCTETLGILLNCLLRYNQSDRKTLQSHKLNYFIKQLVMFLTRGDFQKQYNTYR